MLSRACQGSPDLFLPLVAFAWTGAILILSEPAAYCLLVLVLVAMVGGGGGYYPLVATVEGVVVGVAMLSRPGKIVLLHVDLAWRFSGIGTALLQALEF
jgi:GNAT superfamily N-acetyltransferase